MENQNIQLEIEIIVEKELDDEGTKRAKREKDGEKRGLPWYERPLSLRHTGNMVGGEVESDGDFLRILPITIFSLVVNQKMHENAYTVFVAASDTVRRESATEGDRA